MKTMVTEWCSDPKIFAFQELFEQFGNITSSAVPLDSNGKCKDGRFVVV